MKRRHTGQKTPSSQSRKLQARDEHQAVPVEEEESEDYGQSYECANDSIK